jgi:hypothetical protein
MAMKLRRHTNFSRLQYREIQADTAITPIQGMEQRKRRREKTIQLDTEQKEVAVAKAMATEDEVEMEKYLREAQKAAKAQATKNILARGLEPSDAHMEEKRFLNNMEKEIFWPGSDDEEDADVDEELDDVDRTLLSLGPGDETDDELSEPNVFFRKAEGSNSEQNNHVSTELVNLTTPEETNDSCSEQSETSNPFDNRDDAPSGRNLLVLVDPNRVARIFGPVLRKP